MPTYSYKPENIVQNGVDKMRFELGDTTFAPGELTAALCNEEYTAMISTHSSWKKAKLACLEAILMKFSHQVNVTVDGLSYSFASRIDVWKSMYADEKKKASLAVPTVNPASLGGLGSIDGGHYFHKDMHSNLRRGFGPERGGTAAPLPDRGIPDVRIEDGVLIVSREE